MHIGTIPSRRRRCRGGVWLLAGWLCLPLGGCSNSWAFWKQDTPPPATVNLHQPPTANVSLQSLIDQARNVSTLSLPWARYVVREPVRVKNRMDLKIVFEPGAQVIQADPRQPVLIVENSRGVELHHAILRPAQPAKNEQRKPVLLLENASDVTIRACELSLGSHGVRASNVRKLSLEDNTIHHNTCALGLQNCLNVSILSNTIEDNSGYLQSRDTAGLVHKNNTILRSGEFDRPAPPSPRMPAPPPDEPPPAPHKQAPSSAEPVDIRLDH
jgi:hypothetical protein